MTDQPSPPPVFPQQPQTVQPAAKRNSGAAIASLVLGILSFVFLGPLASLPGLICGIVALSSIKKSGNQLGGRGLAIAGLVLSAVNLVLCVFAILLLTTVLTPALQTARKEARRAVVKVNLQTIGRGLNMYERDHSGQFPPDMAALKPYVPGLKVFVVPGSGTPVPRSAADIQAGRCDLLYFGKGLKADQIQNKATTPIICVKPGLLDGGGTIILFADGHVEDFREIPPDIQKLLMPSARGNLPPPGK